MSVVSVAVIGLYILCDFFSFTDIITTCTYECWVIPYDVISVSSYIHYIACYVYWYVGTAAQVRAAVNNFD